MKSYAIIKKIQGVDFSVFRIEAESYHNAIEIFKGYWQYKYNHLGGYYLYSVSYESFSDMVREDYNYITDFE